MQFGHDPHTLAGAARWGSRDPPAHSINRSFHPLDEELSAYDRCHSIQLAKLNWKCAIGVWFGHDPHTLAGAARWGSRDPPAHSINRRFEPLDEELSA